MNDVIVGLVAVILYFVIGFIAGYYIMSVYFNRRFFRAAERCQEENSFEPLVDEMREVS
ncbi:hypothetical protein [Methanoculleus sp.]|jgi:hypothetical protein|uniref:hypothetical protein n=1 Tax=Methanoculleus sp. TaxID=90427 RepID=UPI0026348D69|nr:hypothetical protein [Methanoculleus sp.]MDI6867356.1 hypothetical protein [Methanoculleus sp.]